MTEKNITVSMGVPLTRTLVYAYTQGKIADLTEESVDEYLAQNLRWRVAGPQGQSIDYKTIPGFKVEVFASTAAKQKSMDEIPKWSEFVPLKKATKGMFYLLSHIHEIPKSHITNNSSSGLPSCKAPKKAPSAPAYSAAAPPAYSAAAAGPASY